MSKTPKQPEGRRAARMRISREMLAPFLGLPDGIEVENIKPVGGELRDPLDRGVWVELSGAPLPLVVAGEKLTEVTARYRRVGEDGCEFTGFEIMRNGTWESLELEASGEQ